MRAARLHDRDDLRVEQIDEPTLKDGQVMVDIAWCGICGSDLHEYILGPAPANKVPHPLTGDKPPVAMGHEFCGRVRNPSSQSGLKDGDAVMVDPRIVCRKCGPCKKGATHACEKMGYHGYNAGGGYAERAAVLETMLYKLPDNVGLDYAAVIEPLAVVVHAIKETKLSDWGNKDILVLGGGPIGLALIIALKAFGAEKIIVSEPAAGRREQVKEFVTAAYNPMTDDVVEKCKEATSGRGMNIVFDCAGVPAGLEVGFAALGFEGQYMNVAVWEKPVSTKFFGGDNANKAFRWSYLSGRLCSDTSALRVLSSSMMKSSKKRCR